MRSITLCKMCHPQMYSQYGMDIGFRNSTANSAVVHIGMTATNVDILSQAGFRVEIIFARTAEQTCEVNRVDIE